MGNALKTKNGNTLNSEILEVAETLSQSKDEILKELSKNPTEIQHSKTVVESFREAIELMMYAPETQHNEMIENLPDKLAKQLISRWPVRFMLFEAMETSYAFRSSIVTDFDWLKSAMSTPASDVSTFMMNNI